MESSYLVRYGLMGHVGQFPAPSDAYGRGQRVVVRTHRGTELGEVLRQGPSGPADSPSTSPRILRDATPDDLERARQADLDRPDLLTLCEPLVRDGAWPLDLIDVEPLLDGRKVVLYYLGPHQWDASGLLLHLRDAFNLDVILEPTGVDPACEADHDLPADDHGCGHCGSATGGCGSSGGCGPSTQPEGGGCSGCTIASLVRKSRPARIPR